MIRKCFYIAAILLLTFGALSSTAAAADVQRFPQPEFDTGYKVQEQQLPMPAASSADILNIAVLAVALLLASWIAHRRRSRLLMWLLSIACLIWFGFYRHGCICPVGSVQNATFAIMNSTATLAWPVIVIFILPLITALFAGRTFCASVCPLGAIQDIVSLRPLRLPLFIQRMMQFSAIIFLGMTIMLAATGTLFLACRIDPFVALFRMHASLPAMLVTTGVLLLGTVISRPYCRAICPYGVILGWLSRISFRHMKITPDDCINCRLCEKSCPVDAIRPPAPQASQAGRDQQAKKLFRLLCITPLIIALPVAAGYLSPHLLSRYHPDIALWQELQTSNRVEEHTPSDALNSFRTHGGSPQVLQKQSELATRNLRIGGVTTGITVALLLFLTLGGNLRITTQKGYEPDKTNCLSCMRCSEKCPREHLRRKKRRNRSKL